MEFEITDNLNFAILQYLIFSGEVKQTDLVRNARLSNRYNINIRLKSLEEQNLIYRRKECNRLVVGVTPEGEERYFSVSRARQEAVYSLLSHAKFSPVRAAS